MSTVTAPADVVDSTTSALENQFGLADRIVDEAALANSVERFRQQGITLPTFAQLENPASFDHATKVGDADLHGADARNLWRVHWYNDLAGNRVTVPDHIVLPSSLTGVESPIIPSSTRAARRRIGPAGLPWLSRRAGSTPRP